MVISVGAAEWQVCKWCNLQVSSISVVTDVIRLSTCQPSLYGHLT